MNAREPPQGLDEMPVGTGVILRPYREAFRPPATAVTKPEAARIGRRRVHQSREGPLGWLHPINGPGDFADPVFHAVEFPERDLEGVKSAQSHNYGSAEPE